MYSISIISFTTVNVHFAVNSTTTIVGGGSLVAPNVPSFVINGTVVMHHNATITLPQATTTTYLVLAEYGVLEGYGRIFGCVIGGTLKPYSSVLYGNMSISTNLYFDRCSTISLNAGYYGGHEGFIAVLSQQCHGIDCL